MNKIVAPANRYPFNWATPFRRALSRCFATLGPLQRVALILVIIIAWPGDARAFNFTPTDIEWQRWPGYCKAKYATTQIGSRSKFARLVNASDRAEMQFWEEGGIRGLHHYCAGSLWAERAKAQDTPDRRASMLRRGRNETDYALRHTDPTSPRFAFVVVQMSMIYLEQGEGEAALEMLFDATSRLPKSELLYSAAAVIQRKLGKTREAKDTLLIGFEATGGNSAEISYNLGLISLELGEIDDAEKYAELAYERGFPLPGLRRKLARARQ